MAYVRNRGTKDAPKWYARYKDKDGKWKQRATGQPTRAAALSWARAVEARVQRGLVGVPEPTPQEQAARSLTVGELAQRFLKEYSRPSKIKDMAVYRHVASADINQMILKFTGHSIGRMLVAEVRRVDVERWRDALAAAGYVPGSVNRGMGRLSRIYNWATERDILPQDTRNPVRGVERMRELPAEEVFSLDEVHRLLALPDLPAMVWCAVYTGMRKGELFGLTWACVRLDAQVPYLDVRRSYRGPPKGGKPRAVPIHPELLPVLRRWRETCPATPVGLVFPVLRLDCGKKLPAGYRMGKTDDMAGLPELLGAADCHLPATLPGRKMAPASRCWHTLRHTFSTLFMEASGNGDAQSKLLGHSQGASGAAAISAGYTHTSLAYLQRELAKMSLLPPAPAGVTSLDEKRRERAAQGA